MKIFRRLGQCFHTAWGWTKILVQVVRGVWKVSSLDEPIVTVFGGSRFLQTDPYALQAHKLAQMFVDHDVSVLTGGGPGIMEAASCGAIVQKGGNGKGISLGINVPGLEGKNPCVHEYFEISHLFARKYLLTHFSDAFVVFPGGFGTLDELAEILTLIKVHKMPRLPIILIGIAYWEPFLAWLRNQVIVHGAISNQDLETFVVTDDLDRAFSLACATCRITFPEVDN
ncbi:MAG: TIGR00730 family Rossman fold protein [Candidatus Babeliales bacterium]|nr:TIGR00730 family Rossman fold protein [Candidatus Babeliales bacterium]